MNNRQLRSTDEEVRRMLHKLTRTQNVVKLPIFSTKVVSHRKNVAYKGDMMLSTSVQGYSLLLVSCSLLVLSYFKLEWSCFCLALKLSHLASKLLSERKKNHQNVFMWV